MLWFAAVLALCGLSLAWIFGCFSADEGEYFGGYTMSLAVGALFLVVAGLAVHDAGRHAGDAEAVERIACETAGGTWYKDGAAVGDEVVYCLESLRPLTVAP